MGTPHKEILAHADVQFQAQWTTLREQHAQNLKRARFLAARTHNSAAMLPAEADCYVEGAKAVILSKAKCIADAYSAFREPVGREAENELSNFAASTVAARKSSFQGQAELLERRTGASTSQLPGLLRAFEQRVHPAILEGRAILDRQRVEVANQLRVQKRTKYVVDTCVFNWLADGRILRDALPSDGGFAITHIQVDEINDTKDGELRARLLLAQASLHCELLPTETFLFDQSRWDYARWGDGKLFSSLKSKLDLLNGGKKSNSRDALIAEVAIANAYTLLTADRDLKSATEEHGGEVIFYAPPKA